MHSFNVLNFEIDLVRVGQSPHILFEALHAFRLLINYNYNYLIISFVGKEITLFC